MENRWLDLLDRFLDGELSRQDRAALEDELAASAVLRRELAERRQLRDLARELQLAPEPDFSARVLMRWRREKNGRLTNRIVAIWPKAAAACILILLAGLLAIYLYEGSITVETLLGVHDLLPEEAYTLLQE